jgi:hypothetical protein
MADTPKQKKPRKKTEEYTLTGPAGLDLAELVLVGTPNTGRCPQRRPLVLSLEEYAVFEYGTIAREIERSIELLRLGPKARARRLAILRGIQKKLIQL